MTQINYSPLQQCFVSNAIDKKQGKGVSLCGPPKQDPDLFYETSGVVLSEKIIDSLSDVILNI